jgi:tRNA (guanine37-N1)-methyltransferase
MQFSVLTIFPEMFSSYWEHGIVKRAIAKRKIQASTRNIRDFASGKHRITDDRPYGGGSGMVMKPEPLARALREAKCEMPFAETILLTPQGRIFDQKMANQLASLQGLILICGRYEGVDERIFNNFVDFEVSLGDYILTGGELGAMAIIDAVTRLIPGVLGGVDSAKTDSFSDGLLKHAQYTRPREFEGEGVPEVLYSGNHKEIAKWRFETMLIRTFLKRKDLFENRKLKLEELDTLKKWHRDIGKIISGQSICGAAALSGDQ